MLCIQEGIDRVSAAHGSCNRDEPDAKCMYIYGIYACEYVCVCMYSTSGWLLCVDSGVLPSVCISLHNELSPRAPFSATTPSSLLRYSPFRLSSSSCECKFIRARAPSEMQESSPSFLFLLFFFFYLFVIYC